MQLLMKQLLMNVFHTVLDDKIKLYKENTCFQSPLEVCGRNSRDMGHRCRHASLS